MRGGRGPLPEVKLPCSARAPAAGRASSPEPTAAWTPNGVPRERAAEGAAQPARCGMDCTPSSWWLPLRELPQLCDACCGGMPLPPPPPISSQAMAHKSDARDALERWGMESRRVGPTSSLLPKLGSLAGRGSAASRPPPTAPAPARLEPSAAAVPGHQQVERHSSLWFAACRALEMSPRPWGRSGGRSGRAPMPTGKEQRISGPRPCGAKPVG